jgi:hypothetical protein
VVLLVRLAADVVVTDGGDEGDLTQLVGSQERGPLTLVVGALDVVAGGHQQLGVRVGRGGHLQGVLPAGLVLQPVTGGADLGVAEEQEVVVALEVLRLEGVRRGPAALGADPVRVGRLLPQVADRGVPVEAGGGGVRRTDGVEAEGAGRELAVEDLGGRGELNLLRGIGGGVPAHDALGLVGADAEDHTGDRGGLGSARGGHQATTEGRAHSEETGCDPGDQAPPHERRGPCRGAQCHRHCSLFK